MNPFDSPEFAKALEAVEDYERFTKDVALLAVEYEAKTITAERFANRTCELMRAQFKKYAERAKA